MAEPAKLTRNAARCRKCNTVIESRSVHDMVRCPCREIFVDGGLEYRRAGYNNEEDYEDLCEYEGESLLEQLQRAGSKWVKGRQP